MAKRLLSGAAAALFAVAAAPVSAAQTVAITGGEVHVGDGEVLSDATVLIEDGRIAAVGTDVAAPEGAEEIDATGMVVTPGLIDASTLLRGIGPPPAAALEDPMIRPGDRAADRFAERMAPEWLRSGVTSVYLAPDPDRLIGGLGAVAKLAGPRETALIGEEVALAASFAEAAVGDSPPGAAAPDRFTTRQGMIFGLRNTLIRAGEDEFTGGVGRTFGRLFAGEIPLRVVANSADDLETALRLAGEFGARLVVDQAAGAAAVASRLAELDVPVVVGPAILGIGDGGPMEKYAHSPATAAVLHEAGVRIALSTFSPGGRSVAMEAAIAWAHGLPREAALAAVTSDAARILGVEDRIGTIAPGLDADVVIWDSHPIGTWSSAMRVLVDGGTVFDREAPPTE